MIWISRQFGLCFLGLCVLWGCWSVCDRLDNIEKRFLNPLQVQQASLFMPVR